MKKQTIFKIGAGLLPLIFFVIVELIFRIFNIFPQIPLFIEQQNNTIRINSSIGERYFNKKKVPVPNLYPQTFSAKKDSNTFRIFCLGGSTTAGFPYEMNVPFPQQLEFQLQREQPDKNFEVINLGLSAVNSFTVWDWLPEVLENEPDLLILYMGHNEFYGAYGTGSTLSAGNNGTLTRFMLRVQKIHLIQMLKKLVAIVTPDAGVNSNQTLMEKMIGNRNIPPDSELRPITYKNYAKNLDLILNKCKQHKTAVIISNLVSNLKDQPPLGEKGKLDKEFLTAGAYYKKGLEEFNQGDTGQAYELFQKALDRDEIPFRAPTRINSIIRKKADRHNVKMIDMLQAFGEYSPFNIPGDSLFCDHLHPNPVGYSLMAERICDKIYELELLLPVGNRSKVNKPLYVTSLDWEIGSLRVFKLEQRWPFSNQEVDYSNYEPYGSQKSFQIAREFLFKHHIWGKAHSDMADYYLQTKDLKNACNEFQAILSMFPDKLQYYRKLIDCAKEIEQWELVEMACLKAIKLTDDKDGFYYNLAVSQHKTGKLNKALDNFQNALDSNGLDRNKRFSALFYKSVILAELGKYTEARKVVEQVIEARPEMRAPRQLLEKIENRILKSPMKNEND
jgi:tetratricopeptide (TPR) repeat protein